MPQKNLNDRYVATVKAVKRTAIYDTKERGLVLRVSPTGNKSWWYVYRLAGSTPQWLGLGEYPDLRLAAARQAALDRRRDVRVEGRNPAKEKRAEKHAAKNPPPPPPAVAGPFTFADMAKLYEVFAKGKKKTWQADVSKIKTYLIPAWGHLPLRDITRRHVHELLDTLVAQGMTLGVNRIQALITRLFTVALDRELVDAHPASRMIKRFSEKSFVRDRKLSDDELRALWAGLDAQPGRAADALRLRLLLGQRGEEVVGMQWCELDLVEGLWELPSSRTKNSRPHAVPLPKTSLALLERRRKALPEDEPRVFPGLTLASDDHRALSTIHGGKYEWKDTRRTVATRLGELGFDDALIGKVLNHAASTITGRVYNKYEYLPEKRQALEAWDRELERIRKNEPKRAAKVRTFQRRA